MKNCIIRLLKIIWVTTATLFILAALLFTAARALTPWAAQHKADIEQWASHRLQMPVHIQQVKLGWRGVSPAVALEHVDVLDKETHQPTFHVNTLYVGLDVLKTLQQRQLQLGKFIVSGAELTIAQQAKNHWSLQGFNQLKQSKKKNAPTHQETSTNHESRLSHDKVLQQLIQQPEIVLKDLTIHLIPQKGHAIHLNHVHLVWRSEGQFHRLSGQIEVKKMRSTPVRFVVQLMGDPLARKQLHVNGYLQVKGLLLSSWLKDMTWQGLRVTSGTADVDISGTMQDGHLHMLKTQFNLHNAQISTANNKKVMNINHMDGDVHWKRVAKGEWAFTVDDLQSVIDGRTFAKQSWRVGYRHDEATKQVTVHAQAPSLSLLNNLAPYVKGLSEKQRNSVMQIQLQGDIHDLHLQVTTKNNVLTDWQIESRFSQLSAKRWQKFPGFEQLTGKIKANSTEGMVLLNSQHGHVALQPLFRDALPFDVLKAKVQWRQQADHWQLEIPQIEYQQRQLALQGSLALTQTSEALPHIESVFHIKGEDITQQDVSRYLPVTLIPMPVTGWLDQAFEQAGKAEATVVLRGPLKQFPFDEHQGTFIVEGKFNDVILRYQPDWPLGVIDTGHLTWQGRGLDVTVEKGQFARLPVQGLSITIPYIGKEEMAKVHIKGAAGMEINQGLSVLQQTPLASYFTEVLQGVSGSGDVDLTLDVTVPLDGDHIPDAQYHGQLAFEDVALRKENVPVDLTHLCGMVTFEQHKIEAPILKAELFNHPATLTLNTAKPAKDATSMYPTVHIQGKIDVQQLQTMTRFPINEFLSGATHFDATIDTNTDSMNAMVSTDFVGLASQLPAPLNKAEDQATPSVIKLQLSHDDAIKFQFQFDDIISAALQYAKDGKALSAGQIHLGGQSAHFQQEPGLLIDGQVPQIDWKKWQALVTRFTQEGESTAHYPLRAVHLAVPTFDVAGQIIHNAKVSVHMTNDGWEFGIDSDELAGIVDVPTDYQHKSLTANFERVHWHVATPEQNASHWDLSQLPDMDIHVKDLTVQQKALGEVSVKLKAQSKGIAINNLVMLSPGFKLQAGGFFKTGDKQQTEFKGTLTSLDTKKMLKQWGLPAHLDSPDAQLGFDLIWPGSMTDFSIVDSQGYVSIRIQQGRITGLSKDTDAKLGLGRLVTLLSLQSLPKRLQLNFKDLTKKGYFFDKMHGDFTLKDGIASTHNVALDGSVAQIDMSGDMDIRDQTYDLNFTVVPNLTSSLPVVATIAGGPVVGAATWVADKLVGKQVNKMTRHRYHVSGTWDEPHIEKVKQQYTHEVARVKTKVG